MSVRNTILDNLKTELAKILPENGYNTAVKKVERYVLPYDTLKNFIPFISLAEGAETKLLEDATNIRYRLEVGAVLFIKGKETEEIYTRINNFLSDFKRCINAPINLGTNCLKVNILNSDPAMSDTEDMSACIIGMEIIYYAAKGVY